MYAAGPFVNTLSSCRYATGCCFRRCAHKKNDHYPNNNNRKKNTKNDTLISIHQIEAGRLSPRRFPRQLCSISRPRQTDNRTGNESILKRERERKKNNSPIFAPLSPFPSLFRPQTTHALNHQKARKKSSEKSFSARQKSAFPRQFRDLLDPIPSSATDRLARTVATRVSFIWPPQLGAAYHPGATERNRPKLRRRRRKLSS